MSIRLKITDDAEPIEIPLAIEAQGHAAVLAYDTARRAELEAEREAAPPVEIPVVLPLTPEQLARSPKGIRVIHEDGTVIDVPLVIEQRGADEIDQYVADQIAAKEAEELDELSLVGGAETPAGESE